MKSAFIHVRKTAGTSFRVNLLDALSHSRNGVLNECRIRSTVELKAKYSPTERAGYLNSFDFIAGHFHDLGSYCDLSSWTTFMFFRDPIARCISAYNHMINDQTDPLHKFCKNCTFDEAIMQPELSSEFENPYYKYLTGCFGSSFIQSDAVTRIAIQGLLKQITYIGITELYDLSLELFSFQSRGALGFSSPKKLNTKITKNGLKYGDVSAKSLARVIIRNRIDAMIYSEALAIFSERGSRMIGSMRMF